MFPWAGIGICNCWQRPRRRTTWVCSYLYTGSVYPVMFTMMRSSRWRISTRISGFPALKVRKINISVFRTILASRGIKDFNTTDVMFNQSKRNVDSKNVEDLFRNCSLSSLRKIISKYRADFLLCGYDETLTALHHLETVKKTEEQKE